MTLATASLRAPNGFHLPNIMKEREDLFEKFGGHPQAAGFSARVENLPEIKQMFLTELQNPKYQNIEGVLSNIIDIEYDELNIELLTGLFALEPFGLDFPMPYFRFKVAPNQIQARKLMGKLVQNHIKITLDNGINLTFFNLDVEQLQQIQETQNPFIFTAKFSQNVWNNQTKYELIGDGFEVTAHFQQ
jgi:single-stranded-DNA-specific exonuclease